MSEQRTKEFEEKNEDDYEKEMYQYNAWEGRRLVDCED